MPADPGAADAAGWVDLSGVSGSGHIDEPPARDYYYFVVFSSDDCDNSSSTSNLTDGTSTISVT